jgi:hypothetical protein
VLLVLLPLYLWIGVMSAIPHKEERFAYVVYPQVRFSAHWLSDSCVPVPSRRKPLTRARPPQVCIGAALVFDTFLELASTRAVVTRLRASRTLATACVCIALSGVTHRACRLTGTQRP